MYVFACRNGTFSASFGIFSPLKHGAAKFLLRIPLEDEVNMLVRNVGNRLPIEAA
jgi:hypothetical protein